MPKIILDVKLYSVKEVAELFGVTYQTAQGYITRGKLVAQVIGGRRYVSEEQLRIFLLGKNNTETI